MKKRSSLSFTELPKEAACKGQGWCFSLFSIYFRYLSNLFSVSLIMFRTLMCARLFWGYLFSLFSPIIGKYSVFLFFSSFIQTVYINTKLPMPVASCRTQEGSGTRDGCEPNMLAEPKTFEANLQRQCHHHKISCCGSGTKSWRSGTLTKAVSTI